jgi:hypothetical protein
MQRMRYRVREVLREAGQSTAEVSELGREMVISRYLRARCGAHINHLMIGMRKN